MFTTDAAVTFPKYRLQTNDFSVQATVTGTGAVTCDVSIRAGNDGVGFVEIATITLSDTDLATNLVAVSASYQYLEIEVETLTGTEAEAVISVFNGRGV